MSWTDSGAPTGPQEISLIAKIAARNDDDAVLAVEPSCRIVVVARGDLGDQAYLLRTGGCPAVGPRHGSPASAKYYVIQLPIVHSGFVAFSV